MSDNLKTKRVIVYDMGLFVELAASLVKTFKEVLYYVPWQADFPSSTLQKIGQDFDGLKRVQSFWDNLESCDLVIFYDTYNGDLAKYLRQKGYRVWGAAEAEQMEINRWQMRQTQEAIGLPTQATLKIKSISDLELYFKGIRKEVEEMMGNENPITIRGYLKNIMQKYDGFSNDYFIGGDKDVLIKEWLNGAKGKYVKANMRGDIESFFAPDYESSLSKFNALSEKIGHRQDAQEIEFVIEELKKGVEPGGDHIQVNGTFLDPTMYGYELKGSGYLGRVCRYDELPKPIKDLNIKLSMILKEFQPTASFFSSEFLIGPDKKPYLIDPTVRNPAPVGSAIYSELIENLGEVIWYGAEGKAISPIMKYKYVAGVALESDWADSHELEVEVDPSIRQWVKFRKCYCKDGKYYSIAGFTSICSVIALGNTIKEVIDLVKQRVEKVKAYSIQKSTSGLDAIIEEVEKGKANGITF